MPETVLRNPNLPGQPFVLEVGADGVVPFEYKAAGFVIDSETSPDDARRESADTSAAAVAAASEVVVTPQFAPDPADAAPDAVVGVPSGAHAAPDVPAEPVTPDAAPADVVSAPEGN